MTPRLPDVSKTLEQLDGQIWDEPEYQSHLVLECHRLRRVPLREFTPANFRIMVGQSIGLEFLAPLALQLLADNPLLDAKLYAGDLLSATLQSDSASWSAHPDLRTILASLAEAAKLRSYALDKSYRELSESAFEHDQSHVQQSA